MLWLLAAAQAFPCGDVVLHPIAGIGTAGESRLQVSERALTEATYEYNLGNSAAWIAAYETEIRVQHGSEHAEAGSILTVRSLSPLAEGRQYTVWSDTRQANRGAPCSETRVKLTGDADFAQLASGEAPPPILAGGGSRGPGRVYRGRDRLSWTPDPPKLALPHGAEAPPPSGPTSVDALPPVEPKTAATEPAPPPGHVRLTVSLPAETRVKIFGDWYDRDATVFLKPGVYRVVVQSGGSRWVEALKVDANRNFRPMAADRIR